MSSDLFAAFGGEPSPTTIDTAQGANQSFPIYQTQHQNLQEIRDEDDDFGDFEDASASNAPLATEQEPISPSAPVSQPSSNKPFTQPSKELGSTGRSSNLPVSPNPVTKPEPTPRPAATTEEKSRVGQHPFAGKWDLLFEAGDDEYDAGADELGDLSNNPEAAMAYSKRIIAEQQAAQLRKPVQKTPEVAPKGKAKVSDRRTVEQTKSEPRKLQKKSGYAPPVRNADVLFDAENLSEHEDSGDDFGEFETWDDPVPTTKSTSTTKSIAGINALPAVDLLGLEDPEPNTAASTGTSSSRTRASQHKHRSDHDRMPQPTSIPTEDMEDSAWDDFETSTFQTSSQHTPPSPPSNILPSQPSHPSQTHLSQPPTNIPPPLLLLTLFPSLFTSADTALFTTLSRLPLAQRHTLLAHPATHQFLRTYLSHATVLARIIAGRKLRWKRDTRLSQSMRIGPSAAGGGKGGMKLAGLDKTEIAKEDREVLDVLRQWKAQVGKLRTAITSASAAPGLPKLSPLPDVAEQMPVKVLKSIEGGITAPHACALCGLRRDERIARVDVEVEDSFGEWWVQGANMHVGCEGFWAEFEGKLKSR